LEKILRINLNGKYHTLFVLGYFRFSDSVGADSAIRNTYWAFRVFDYPRFQKFIILLILIFAWFFTFENPNIYEQIILAVEIICAGYLFISFFLTQILGKR
jgi:hypothetical protein